MAGKILSTPTIGGVRKKLAEELPLSTPYLIQMFPVYACNFRCGYCIYSLDKTQRGYISQETYMDFAFYKKCIEQIADFPQKVKMLRFAAIGEPLLHRNIAEMIDYAKERNVAESLDIVTNASLLHKDLADRLIQAGLSKLRISLEGLSTEDYQKNCGVRVDFDKLVENISYFYQQRQSTKVYIKIIDYMVQADEQKQKFFDIFTPICDEIAIEHITPTIAEIDYDKLTKGMKAEKPQNGEQMIWAKICPQPFYMCQINPDGNIVPCCSMKYPTILGNVHKESVQEIWRGDKYNKFRRDLLSGVDNAGAVCKECNLYLYAMHIDDVLDQHVDKFREKYQ